MLGIVLKGHEKTAFLKFFITYFVSVALLILAIGFFYFEQMKGQLVKKEHFSLIEYARHLKMNEVLYEFSDDYHHEYIDKHNKHINIRNFEIDENEFSKFIPLVKSKYYLKVYKSKDIYIQNMYNLKIKIIVVQTLLLLLFALISYFLAKKALAPLNESIQTLDKFAKDLIHDLNTPVGAMKLNIKILEKDKHLDESKAFLRLKKSIDTITELRENLTTLLEKKTFQVSKINICDSVRDVLHLYQPKYKNLSFEIYCQSLVVEVNENAIKQILHNIISNACKYNKKDGFVKIYIEGDILYIQDGGLGIAEPEKIFDREYSTQNSTGLGLDIVKRLSNEMNIDVGVASNENGSTFSLEFKK